MISSKPLSIAQTSCSSVSARKWPWPRQSDARAADPLVEDAAAVELDAVLELRDEVRELRIGLVRPQLVRHLERHGHERPRFVGQRRFGHEDLVIAVGQALDDLGRGLFPREIEEELLDVLNFQGALMEAVLLQEIFHGTLTISSTLPGRTMTVAFRANGTATEAQDARLRGQSPLFRPQRDDRIDARGPAGRDVGGEERDDRQGDGDGAECDGVARLGAEEQIAHHRGRQRPAPRRYRPRRPPPPGPSPAGRSGRRRCARARRAPCGCRSRASAATTAYESTPKIPIAARTSATAAKIASSSHVEPRLRDRLATRPARAS